MNPITRKEMFLAAAGGQDVETPTPVTREEVFLDEIAKGGGGGGAMLVPLTLHPNMQNLKSSKTFQEIKEAYSGGQPVIFAYDDDNLYFSLLTINSNGSLLYIYYIKPSDSSIIEVHGSATSSPLFPYQSL